MGKGFYHSPRYVTKIRMGRECLHPADAESENLFFEILVSEGVGHTSISFSILRIICSSYFCRLRQFCSPTVQ